MKSKYVLAFFLVLPLVVYLYWIASLEKQLYSSKEVMVAMNGFDPVDLLSGHYLLLRPDWNNTDCAQFEQNRCPTELFAYSYRYYLPEVKAMDVDREIASNENLKVEISFAINGKANPLVKELYINGQQWKIWFNQFAK